MAALLDKYFNDTFKANPLAYYRMREGSGTTLVDSTSNVLNGTYNGSGVTWTAIQGSYGQGIASGKNVPIFNSFVTTLDLSSNPIAAVNPSLSTFDGVAGRASSTLTGINTAAASSVTLEMWVRWDGVLGGTVGTYEAIANFGGAAGLLLGFLKNGASDYRFGLSVRNTGDLWGLSNATTLAVLPRDVFHHIVFVIVNNNVQASKLYINGVLYTMNQQIGVSTTTDSVTSAFTLGYDGTSSFFQGTLSEVAVFNGEPYNAAAMKNRYHQGAYGGEYQEVVTIPGIESQIDIGYYNQVNMNNKDMAGPGNRTRTLNQYYITDIGGLDDADIRFQEESNFYRDGMNPLVSRYGGRTITLTGYIEASNFQKLRQMQTQMKSALTTLIPAAGLTEIPVIFRNVWNNGFDIITNARKNTGLQMAESQKSYSARRDFLITMRSSFPYLESAGSRTDIVGIGATVALPNKGNAPAFPQIVVYGPLTDAQIIINSAFGNTNTRITGTMASGVALTIDSKARFCNGWSLITTTSDFPSIPPTNGVIADGYAPYIAFTSVVGGTFGATRIEVTWRHTVI